MTYLERRRRFSLRSSSKESCTFLCILVMRESAPALVVSPDIFPYLNAALLPIAFLLQMATCQTMDSGSTFHTPKSQPKIPHPYQMPTTFGITTQITAHLFFSSHAMPAHTFQKSPTPVHAPQEGPSLKTQKNAEHASLIASFSMKKWLPQTTARHIHWQSFKLNSHPLCTHNQNIL